LRIALICSNFPPEFQGGTERVALALARSLQDLGEEVVVLSGSDQPHRGEDVEREDGLGVPVMRLRRKPDEGYGLEINRPRLLALEESLLVQHEIDVVHLHHWATLSFHTLRMARRRELATVATLHDMWTTCPRFFRKPPDGITCPEGEDRESCGPCVKLDFDTEPLWKLRLGVAMRDHDVRGELLAAHRVTAPSRSFAAAVADRVPWEHGIEIVPHGLLEPVAREVAQEEAARQPFRVGTFGNLVRDKGVAVLVEAMAGVAGAELHLFGPFLDAAFEREIADLAARHDVTLTCHGRYDAAGPHPARELDLAVFPSLCEESYGLVVDEAMARGVPVVVSDLGALAERCAGGGGVVTPAGDVRALRAAVREIVASTERYVALKRRLPREFSTIGDAAKRYVELYRSAMEVPA
jgi:glycosyltransferase involved in cell wall biosynthesis